MLIDKKLLDDPRPAFRKSDYLDVNPLSGSRKRRILYKPNDEMRAVHQQIIESVRLIRRQHISNSIAPIYASPLKNVAVHRSGRHFFLVDFHDAYRHVNLDRLVEAFYTIGSIRGKEEVLRAVFQRFCFADEGGLATGAPASPDLFNLYAGVLVDEPLWDLLKHHANARLDAVRYSRYLDDLTMSFVHNPFGTSIRWRIKQVAKAAGFVLSRKKTSPPLDLKKGPITITGLRLAWGGRIFVPRHYIRLFRKKLRFAIERRIFEDEWRIEKMAGMHGVFWSGIDRGRSLTGFEQEVVALWKEYLRLRQEHIKVHRQ